MIKDPRPSVTYKEAFIQSSLATIPYAAIYFITGLARIAPFHFLQGKPNEMVAAYGIASSIFFIIGYDIILALLFGLLSRLSPCYGARNFKLMGYTMHRGAVICLIACILLSILFLFSAGLLELIGYDALLSGDIQTYLVYNLPALYLYWIFNQLQVYLSSIQIFTPQSIIQISGLPVFIVSLYIFCEKYDMGLIGTCYANIIMNAFDCLVMIGYFLITKPYSEAWFLPDRQSIQGLWELFVHEFWVGSVMFLDWAAVEIINLMSGALDRAQTVAFTGAFSILNFFYSISTAMGNTVLSLVGGAAGERDSKKGKILFEACLMVTGVGIVMTELVLIIFLGDMSDFLMNNAETQKLLVQVMHIYMLVIPFDYIQYTVGAGFRAIGKEKVGFLILLISYYCIGIPLAYVLCFRSGEGIDGLMWGLNAMLFSSFVISSIVYYFVDWEVQFRGIHEVLEAQSRDISSDEEADDLNPSD